MMRSSILPARRLPLRIPISVIAACVLICSASPAAAQCVGDPPDVIGTWELVERVCVTFAGTEHWTPETLGYTEQLEFRGDGTMTIYRDEIPQSEGTWSLACTECLIPYGFFWCLPENEPFVRLKLVRFPEVGELNIADVNLVDAGCAGSYILRGIIVPEERDTWGDLKLLYR